MSANNNPECEWCKKTFARKANVNRHKLICPNRPRNEDENKTVISSPSHNDFLLEKGRLIFNDIIIPCRESDGFVYLTELSRASGHRLDNYLQSKNTQAFLAALRKLPIFQGECKLLVTEEGKYGGTWAHRFIAYNYAQYVSGEFAAQVCVWLDELFQYKKIELNGESDIKDLENNWREKFLDLESKHKALYNPEIPASIPNFAIGFYIYLISDSRDIFREITYGKTKDMNDRAIKYQIQFKCVNPIIHKTWKFDTQEEINDIESILHIAFRKYRNPAHSEWLSNISIQKAITIVDSSVATYKIQSENT